MAETGLLEVYFEVESAGVFVETGDVFLFYLGDG